MGNAIDPPPGQPFTPVLRRVFHVIGVTQYAGTCKFHIFRDCSQLQKKRVAHMAWGDRISTGVIHEDEYEIYRPGQICMLCQKREDRSKVTAPEPSSA